MSLEHLSMFGMHTGGIRQMAKKTLNIGLVGYGFMGRTHSNAFLQAPRFFDLPYQPVLKAVCARNADRVTPVFNPRPFSDSLPPFRGFDPTDPGQLCDLV